LTNVPYLPLFRAIRHVIKSKRAAMRSSNGGFLSTGPVYSLLAIYMPLTILAALIFILETIMAADLPAAVIMLCAVISGISASIYCDFMKDDKSSRTAANIRGAIIIIFVCYITSSALNIAIPWKEKLLPDFYNLLPSFGALFIWINVISLKQLFSSYRNFIINTEIYRGEKLREVFFEDTGLLYYNDENINKAERNYFLQLFIIAFLVIICGALKKNLSFAVYSLLAVIFLSGICIIGFFGIIKTEHYYAGEGLALSTSGRIKRILAMIIITLLCFIFALLFSSDKNLLSFSYITGFFVWLFSLFDRPKRRIERTINSEEITYPESPQEFMTFEEMPVSPIISLIIKYFIIIMKYGLIILIAAGFIRFMISPFINRGDVSEKMPFYRRFFYIIAEWFSGVLSAIKTFFTELKEGRDVFKLRKYSAEEIRRTAETIFGAYSPAKKSDMRQSVTLFAQLIIWGNDIRNVVWKPNLAPAEYCAILSAAHTPENAPNGELIKYDEEIIRCGELFEKALYSAEVLSDMERSEFKNLVEEITSSDY
jgi:hypothetical protein